MKKKQLNRSTYDSVVLNTSDKVAVLEEKVNQLVEMARQQGELLKAIAPKPPPAEIVVQYKPHFKPSAHMRSLIARSEADLEQLAFGPRADAEPKVQQNPVKHPTLGSL